MLGLLLAVPPPIGPVQEPSSGQPPLWLPPLDDELQVSAFYALPNGPFRAGHRGIDLPTAPGQVVCSPTAGVVSFVGDVVDRPVLSIRVDEATVLSLEPVSSELAVGEAVARGQPVGIVAEGGHCDGGCLHLGTRVDGAYVNPMRFLRPRPELEPW